MLKIKPLDTILTAFDDPLYVDVEVDKTPVTIEVYLDGQTIPFTQFTMTSNYARIRVFSTNPYGSTPTNQVHGFTFSRVDTGETVRVEVAYIGTRVERVEFRKPGMVPLTGMITTILKRDGKVFYRRTYGTRLSPLNVTDHSTVFYEFFSQEGSMKYYFVARGDKLISMFGGAPDLTITLGPTRGIIVEVEYELPKIVEAYRSLLPQLGRFGDIISGFLNTVTDYVVRFSIGVAKFLGKAIGLQSDIVDARVEGSVLKVQYAVDPPHLAVLAVLAIAIVSGSYVAIRVIDAIRDILVVRYEAMTYTTAFNSMAKADEEATKATEAVLEYAQKTGLTYEQTLELLQVVLQQYETGDRLKALELYKQSKELTSQVDSLKSQRLLFGLAGAGVGAAIVAVLTRGR